MHDFAMSLRHDCRTSETSHTQEGLRGNGKTYSETLTPAHEAALRVCLTSIHGILNAFLAFTPHDVRTIPTSVFARVAYASILLIRTYLAASLPESEPGKFLSGDEMNVERYISGLIDLLRAGAANGKSRPAHNFSLVMAMLHVWYEKQVNDSATSSGAAAKGVAEQSVQDGEAQGAQSASAPREHHQQSHSSSALGQTPLHLLSEVAMGNSGSTSQQVPNGGGGTYDPNCAQTQPPSASKADFYPPSMVGDGLRRMHPGFAQALGMTLAGGDANITEDDGLFDLMQKWSNVFDINGG